MSAVLKPVLRIAPMTELDLKAVLAIEKKIYPYPWTAGNFRDSLRAGYHCRVFLYGEELIGYAVFMIAVGEAHLLNLSVAGHAQGRGLGRELLSHVVGVARERGARALFLEVRPSNEAGRRLYAGYGFGQVGVRRGYYPAGGRREDALVFALNL
jgi:ribosomal-protein-alanine N-acetyltransferase